MPRVDPSERNDHVLSLSERTVTGLKAAAGGRRWRRFAEELLECLAPTLLRNHKNNPLAEELAHELEDDEERAA